MTQTPAITLAQAQTQLSLFITAEATIAGGAQEYSIAGRAFKRADLNYIGERIAFYQTLVDRLNRNASGNRITRVVPLDF
jgi:hypothetical protein